MWVNVNNGRLYAETSGKGPPILLIHGWPLDHRVFEAQMAPLSENLMVIAYDRRGFGRSDASPDLRLELDDIDRILADFAIETVHLLGMSQGGRIALRYAVTRPERLRSLILQGAVVDGLSVDEIEADRVPVTNYAELAKDGKLDEVRRQWLSHPMMHLDAKFTHESKLLEKIVCGYNGTDLVQFEPDAYSFSRNVLAEISNFKPPALILTGAQETMTRRRHAIELMDRMPNCQEIILRESGHLSNLTEPGIYNKAIIDFCRNVDRSAGSRGYAPN